MAHVHSNPVDEYIQRALDLGGSSAGGLLLATRDVVIVGSGYGASVAATRLAGLEKSDGSNVSVLVLERGREYAVGEFPNHLGELPGHVRLRRPSDPHPTGNPDALFDFRLGEDLDILVGNGLGGGSLINANVAAEPAASVFDETWPEKYRNGGLDGAYEKLRELLGVSTTVEKRAKFSAFETLANAMNAGSGSRAAPITVTHGAHGGKTANEVGVIQPNCEHCGNCVTGCNVGSKNTLVMNLIPLAKQRGAEFMTGANVLTVEPRTGAGASRWRVALQRTHSIRTPLEKECYFVDARYVILAAGALGSTEILARSDRANPELAFSGELGSSFSSNGDGLGFSFGQEDGVEAIGTTNILAGTGPGPTITGIVQGKLETASGEVQPFTLEEAAVPASILKVFGEALTTGAELHRIGKNELPGWFDVQPHKYDPLAYNPEILEHAQVFLMMSDDGAPRRLALQGPADSDIAQQSVFPSPLKKWQQTSANAGLTALDEALVKHDRKAGLDRGQYVANPLWRLLPAGASDALGGNLPSMRNLSVHPLGGCRMAEDSAHGVVNADGAVFDPTGGATPAATATDAGRLAADLAGAGKAVHAGLFVMDGSVIPRALATNPFLTIGAVAWTCCDALLAGPFQTDAWSVPAGRPDTVSGPVEISPVAPKMLAAAPPGLVLREQLLGQLRPDDWDEDDIALLGSFVPNGARLLGRDGMILRVTTEPIDVHSRFASLANGPVVISADVELFVNPETHEQSTKSHRYGAPASLAASHRVAAGTARISILSLDEEDAWTARLGRAWDAFWAYLSRRAISLSGSDFGQFKEVAFMHASYREFRYDFTLTSVSGAAIEFGGRKRIRWHKDFPRLWDSLLKLPVEVVKFSKSGDSLAAPVTLGVDMDYMLGEGLIQIDASHDMVESALSAASFLLWFARCLLQTSFWEFGAPKYPTEPKHLERNLDPPKLKTGWFSSVKPEAYPLPVDAGQGKPKLPLELVRYPQKNGGGEPVLLLHGLAQGSGIFSTPEMSTNMATYFWKLGYDVWLFDYRLSNRFDQFQVPYGDWAIDVIGEVDIPAAVEEVFGITGRKLKVFAHCVGAVAVQMAILRGRLKHQGEDMLESVCFNAIHPWIVPAPANIARSKLGAFASTWISDDFLNPIPPLEAQVGGTESLMDRIAYSLARIEEGTPEGGEGHGKEDAYHKGICDRMSFLYGRMWRHENLENGVKKRWLDLVGRAPVLVYLQLYYLLEHGRILDDRGHNTYLKDQNILDNWTRIPTFFLHGEESDVFNPHSATISANRLKQILELYQTRQVAKAPVYLRRVPGYGHMDPILAKNAHEDVYPDIAKFFELAAKWAEDGSETPAFDEIESGDDPDAPAVLAPETGHAVRAAWIDGQKIAVRYWFERYAYNTSPSDGVAVRLNPNSVKHYDEVELIYPDGSDRSYVWLDDRPDPATFEPQEVYDVVKGPAALSVIVPEGFDPDGAYVDFLAGLFDVVFRTFGSGVGHSSSGLAPVSPHTPLPPGGSVSPGAPLQPPTGGPQPAPVGPPEVPEPGPMDPNLPVEDKRPHWYRRLIARLEKQPGADETLRFLVSSCRYPGTPVESALSDDVFGGMLARNEATELDSTFFIGDQIYADAYNDLFANTDWEAGYLASYRAAYNSPRMRRLLRSMPVHFAIDDHEIVDNWSGGASERTLPGGRRTRGPQALTYGGITAGQVEYARQAARRYLGSARSARAVGAAAQPPHEALWYEFDHQSEINFPSFVLDTRSERALRSIGLHEAAGDYPAMIGKPQLDAFEAWLLKAHAAAPTRPKFVFAGQILAPVTDELIAQPQMFRREDGFFGYPATLRAIIGFIVSHEIANVVFVGGDLHMSCAAELTLGVGAKTVTAWQIVASGLYAPMAFANSRPSMYSWSTPRNPTVMPPGDGVRLGYVGEWLTDRRAHFLEVDVARVSGREGVDWSVTVGAFAADGTRIQPEKEFDRTGGNLRVVFA